MSAVVLYGHRVEQPGATGIGYYVRRLITAIASSEHHDITYSVGATPEPPSEIGPPSGLPVLRPNLPRSRSARRLLHLSWLVTGRPRVDRAFHRPDLLHVLYPAIPVPTRARLVFTIHDLMALTNPDWVTRYEHIRYARSFKQAADRAELLIADSQKTAREIPEILGVEESRIRVIHLGVDPVFWGPVDGDSIEQACRKHDLCPGRYFVVLGTVSTRKNLQVLLNALAVVKGQLDYPVIAVGPRGLGIEAIEDQVERLGVRQLVRLPGWLPEPELLALLHGSTALLHPSRDEGFGLTPLEGMAAGIPVAASNAGAIPEVTADAALLIDPDDVESWSNAMLRLAGDDEFRNEAIARGHSRARLFTWERTANETIAVHRELLSGIKPVRH